MRQMKSFDHRPVAPRLCQCDSPQALPFSNEQRAHFKSLSQQSITDQKKIEASDSMPFEVYREQYVSADRLNVPKKTEKEAVLSA